MRDFLLNEYGRKQNKTLIHDSNKKGGTIIGLKCKHCNSFKLNCVNKKKNGGWKFSDGNCNFVHDVLCMGSYTATTVSEFIKLII